MKRIVQNVGIEVKEITEFLIGYQNVLNGSYYKKLFVKNEFSKDKSEKDRNIEITTYLHKNLQECIEKVIDCFASEALFEDWQASNKKDHERFLDEEKIKKLPYGKNFIKWILDNYKVIEDTKNKEVQEESKTDEDTDGTGKSTLDKK